MLASIIRFIAKGWVHSMYVKPKLFFPYYGFEWVKPLGETGMYAVFTLMALAALFIILGLYYRLSAFLFFFTFTYVELIDKTNYLNHYYFISIMSLLMVFLPANRYFSLDAKFNPSIGVTYIPNYFILIIKFQVFVVYFFAGLAKVNPDWLFEAQPLRIWLPAHSEMPVIGPYMTEKWVAYAFSWFGCIYDLAIPFLLFVPRFIKPAYFFVVAFHLATSLFFNIGMFPYVMIALTTIFFSEQFHIKLIEKLSRLLNSKQTLMQPAVFIPSPLYAKTVAYVMCLHFFIQLVLPFRYLFYDGHLFWTEQGFRFSWRVMLIEKAGTTFFFIHDKKTGKEIEIDNRQYLTQMQEKMMSTQPDMMLQYAKFLKQDFEKKGMKDPAVLAQAYVTLNGKSSKLMVDKNTDLSMLEDNFAPKNWIIPFDKP